ncbi:putative Histidine kinase [Azospirillaceae bacterium]
MKIGIQSRLCLVVGLIGSVSLIAGIVTWVLYQHVQVKVNEILSGSLPCVDQALKISVVANRMAVTAVGFFGGRQDIQRLDTYQTWRRDQLFALSAVEDVVKCNSRLEEYGKNLHQNLFVLDKLFEQQNQLIVQRNRAASLLPVVIVDLTRQHHEFDEKQIQRFSAGVLSFESDAQARQDESKKLMMLVDELVELLIRIVALAGDLEENTVSDWRNQVRNLEKEIGEFNKTGEDARYVNSDDIASLFPNSLIEGPGGILTLQEIRDQSRRDIGKIQIAMRDEVARMISMVVRLVNEVEKDASFMSKHLIRDLNYGRWVIAGMAMVAFIGPLLILWFYVGWRIVRRLSRLVADTRKIAAGELHSPIHRSGDDEITEMMDALLLFRGTAVAFERQAHELALSTEALERAKEEAIFANEAKSQFLATMSHEIRTPMNGVLGMLELLHHTQLEPNQERLLSVARQSSEILLALIDDILDLTKIESGCLVMRRQAFSIAAVVDGVMELLAPTAFNKNIELVVFVDPQAPSCVLGDPVRFRQILYNLIGNAVKFVDQGRVSIEVLLKTLTSQQATLVVRVTDSGIGLTSEQITRLFEPFVKTENNQRGLYGTRGGSGLGLSICRRLAQAMGGEITLETSSDSGCVFRLLLPFDLVNEENLSELSVGTESEYAFLQDVSVLVIEPDAEIRRVIGYYLQDVTRFTKIVEDFSLSVLENNESGFDVLIVNDEWKDDESQDRVALNAFVKDAVKKGVISMTHPVRRSYSAVRDVLTSRSRVVECDDIVFLMKPIARERLLMAIAMVVGAREEIEKNHNHHAPRLSRQYVEPEENQARQAGAVILAAEDNPSVRFVVSQQLSFLGVCCEIVSDGAAAWEKLSRCGKDYAMLLTDCSMPKMDGYRLTTAIRTRERVQASGRRLPIVALTANAMAGEAEWCLTNGMDGYLSKPVNLTNLESILIRWAPQAIALRRPLMSNGEKIEACDDECILSSVEVEKQIDLAASLFSIKKSLDQEQKGADGVTIFNPDCLRSWCGGFNQISDRIMRSFLDSTDDIIRRIPELMAMEAWEELSRFAHSVKGAANSVGAVEMGVVCQKIEYAAFRNENEVVQSKVVELYDAYERITVCMQKYLDLQK